MYGDEYHGARKNLWFVEVAFEWYVSLEIDVYGTQRLAGQLGVRCDGRCEELGPEIPDDGHELKFKRLATFKEQKGTGVRGKLREIQDVCRAERGKIPSSVIEVIEEVSSAENGANG